MCGQKTTANASLQLVIVVLVSQFIPDCGVV